MAKPETSLTLIGGGRMGSALAGGWISTGGLSSIGIVDPDPSQTLTDWEAAGKITLNPPAAPADTLVIAVKPQVFPKVADSLTAYIGPKTDVLSIMAGIPLDQLAETLGTTRVARAMPNTPGLIGKGVAILSMGRGTDTAMADKMRDLLAPLGLVEGPVTEAQLTSATAISGCGPAYLFLLAEVMAGAGASSGLDPDFAARIARATVEGAAALMAESEDSPETLRRNVTSPNGVTQAALDVLMDED